MIITFIIPNRDDSTKPPVLYDEWGADVVPREGETVYLGEPDEVRAWAVKWVRHTFVLGKPPRIEVRLTEAAQ